MILPTQPLPLHVLSGSTKDKHRIERQRVGNSETERNKERETETDREVETKTDREEDKETETKRETDRQTYRESERKALMDHKAPQLGVCGLHIQYSAVS